MKDMTAQVYWQTISVPIGQFNVRLTALTRAADSSGHASMHSRLSLIHQTAKQYAVDAARQTGVENPVVDIDELTNPPLFDLPIDIDDAQSVIIRYTYSDKPGTG